MKRITVRLCLFSCLLTCCGLLAMAMAQAKDTPGDQDASAKADRGSANSGPELNKAKGKSPSKKNKAARANSSGSEVRAVFEDEESFLDEPADGDSSAKEAGSAAEKGKASENDSGTDAGAPVEGTGENSDASASQPEKTTESRAKSAARRPSRYNKAAKSRAAADAPDADPRADKILRSDNDARADKGSEGDKVSEGDKDFRPGSTKRRANATVASKPQVKFTSEDNHQEQPGEFDPQEDESEPIGDAETSGRTSPDPSSRTSDETHRGKSRGEPGASELEGLQSPALSIAKVAPPELQVGKSAVIEIHIKNTGKVAARQLEIRDEVPRGAELVETTPNASRGVNGELVWSLGMLKPGDETIVKMEIVPTTEGEIGSVATVHFVSESSSRSKVTKPALALEVAGPRELVVGDAATLQIKVSNRGTGIATGVVLSDQLPSQLSHEAGPEIEYPIGDLMPGDEKTLQLTIKGEQPGQAHNVLIAKGEGAAFAEQKSNIDVVSASLEVAVDGPKRRYLDRQATYVLTVSNPGSAAANEVELVTYLPKGLKFVEANNAGQYDAQSRSVHWLLEELPANESGTVTLITLPVEAGEHVLKVEGKADRGLSAMAETSVRVDGVAAIHFQVADMADPIEIGGETTYEIIVVNQGTKSATNVEVVVELPQELTFVSAEGLTRFSEEGRSIIFQPLSQLAPKSESSYHVRVKGDSAGDVRVKVQVTADELKDPVTKEESTRIYEDE